MTGSNGTLPAPLAMAARQFGKWRSLRRGRRRIPEELWKVAVDMAGRYGVNPTAEALRLNYEDIVKHRELPARWEPKAPSGFVEVLPPAAAAPATGSVVEFEDPRGAKMRVHLVGDDTPDLVALGRLFLGRRA